MSGKALVLAGGTGLVGAAVIEAALARGWRVLAVVRRSGALPARQGLDEIAADFERLEELRDSLAPAKPLAFICALGTTIRTAGSQPAFARVDRDYAAAFASLGVACGAGRFGLVSAVGADSGSRNFYLRTKGEAEDLVKAAGYERVEIARPSFLVGDRREMRIGERAAIPVARAFAPLLVGGLSIYRPIGAEVVARGLVAGVERAEPGVFVRHFDDLVAMASA
jgi:uncharacterized protein YbjT (DUF2867 family)